MLTIDEDEQYRRGLAASSLLANEDFKELIRSLTVESFAIFTETKPHETAKREEQYNLSQGLKAIEAELQARVQVKDAIDRRENEAEEIFDTEN